MQRRLALALLAVTVLAATAALVPVAHGTKSGADGPIAYTRYRYENSPLRSELWVTNADGTGARKLDVVPPNTADDQPDWSPDGKSIAFARCPAGRNGVCALYTIRSDGTQLTRLSAPCPPAGDLPKCVDDSTPAYSPDGKSLAFSRAWGKPGTDRPQFVALMVGDLHLHHLRRVAYFGQYGGDPYEPAWSPDGKRLVFDNDEGTKLEPGRKAALYIVNADGTGLRRLTPFSLGATDEADWSPDGSTILFRGGPGSFVDPGGGNLYTIRPDGTDLQQLTHFPNALGVVHNGSFSPDGQSIVFATSYNATNRGDIQHPDLFVMRADGTDMRPITRTINWEDAPDWGSR
jgi:Tol biopolymer transport system component